MKRYVVYERTTCLCTVYVYIWHSHEFRNGGNEERLDYLRTLISLRLSRHIVTGCPR